jgi:hypothetical protein
MKQTLKKLFHITVMGLALISITIKLGFDVAVMINALIISSHYLYKD